MFLFFFNDTATTEIYTLSLHDALPISLALSMGLPANVPYDIEVVPDTTTPVGIVEGVDSLIARAMRERPDLAAQRALVDQARARVTVARSQALPTLTVGGNTGDTYFINPAAGF